MNKLYKIKRGLNIKLAGVAEKIVENQLIADKYVLRPVDFVGLTPKLVHKEGDKIKRGETVYFDKYNPDIKFTSPVSGIIAEIEIGEKRKLLKIVIISDNNDDSISFNEMIGSDNPEDIILLLTTSGVWPYFKQRPYGIIANPDDIPRDIFVSFFDSAPLAPDYELILGDKKTEINNMNRK